MPADHEGLDALYQRYCDAVDRRDGPALAELFEPDARFANGDSSAVGRDAIVALLAPSTPRPAGSSRRRHRVGPVDVADAGPERARSSARFLFVAEGDGGLRAGAGRYVDVVARSAGVWRFVERSVELDIPVATVALLEP